MAPLVPVPSASHILQQAQGVQWMAPLARVPSAPQVGSLHKALRMAPQVPVPPCRFLPPALGLTDVT